MGFSLEKAYLLHGALWGMRGIGEHVACTLICLMYVMYHMSEITGEAQKCGNDGCGDRKSPFTCRREQQQCRQQWCSLTQCSRIVSLEVKRCLQFHDACIIVLSSKALFSVFLCPTSAGAHNMLGLKRLEYNVTTLSRRMRPPH